MADAMHDLCRILDERGAEYSVVLNHVEIGGNALILKYAQTLESDPGAFCVVIGELDAQQAVNAILGPKDNARDELIYALNECRNYSGICEHCPHSCGADDFDRDPQYIQCHFDFDKLMREAGVNK